MPSVFSVAQAFTPGDRVKNTAPRSPLQRASRSPGFSRLLKNPWNDVWLKPTTSPVNGADREVFWNPRSPGVTAWATENEIAFARKN
jgi:hypothetical protein